MSGDDALSWAFLAMASFQFQYFGGRVLCGLELIVEIEHIDATIEEYRQARLIIGQEKRG
jgi:hypothetical protein